MNISSLIFIYLFLPVTLFFVYISSRRFKNVFLLAASWLFYAWGGVSYLSILIGITLVNYIVGILLERSKNNATKKAWLIAGIILNILPLVIFKYTGFLKDNINELIALFNWSPLVIRNIVMPLGISFYTFKAITYLMSVKRGETGAQRNYIDLALYISFFPNVMAGPIDRYRNFLPQLHDRIPTAEQFASGIRRFTIGLAKKVIIANSVAVIADELFGNPISAMSTPLAWLGVICYAFQIYFDFSGYSDMAIGVGRMFGFELMENFNFPYISKSIKEFWQRWHISLSTWLRDYLFLPLAYNFSRKMKNDRTMGIRTDQLIYILATTITFFICGFWHGAAWNFIIWGLFHGLLLILEQIGLGRLLKKIYTPFRHLYAVFFLLISWVFFRTESLHDAFQYIGVLFGIGAREVNWPLFFGYFNTGTVLTLIICILGSTRFFTVIIGWIRKSTEVNQVFVRNTVFNIYEIASILTVILLLAASSVFIVAGTNNAFIYFRF